MKEKHEGCIRGYIRSSKAWYGKKEENISVIFGMYSEEGGTSGEMTMEWIELGGQLCAKLKSFEDSWSALSLFTDLIQKMEEVDGENIQEEEFCKMLEECGFKDMTSYINPYIAVDTPEEEMVEVKMPKKQAIELGFIKKQK